MTRTLFTTILSVAVLGCGREYRDDTPTPPPATAYRAPAPAPLPTATVSGRVTWRGDIPTVPAINGLVRTRDGSKWGDVPNHFAPQIDANSRAVAGAVVWLTGIDPAKAKPWPYPPLTVEVRDFAVTVDEDPGKDFGEQGKPAHRFFFRPEEVEPLDADEGGRS